MREKLTEFPQLLKAHDALAERFPETAMTGSFEKNELVYTVDRAQLIETLTFLKTGCGFNALNDIIGLDNSGIEPAAKKRFTVLYLLYSFPDCIRMRLAVDVDESEPLPSVVSLYRAADWAEREIFDMFGLEFEGHPNLKRIYMTDDWEGHPLRKDYPLEGKS